MPVAAPTDTAGAVRDSIAGQVFDCAEDVAILDAGVLCGVLPIEQLVGGPG